MKHYDHNTSRSQEPWKVITFIRPASVHRSLSAGRHGWQCRNSLKENFKYRFKSIPLLLLAFLWFLTGSNSFSQESQLAQTPPMGWMTWNMFGPDISEDLLIEMADAIKKTGRPMIYAICEWGQRKPWTCWSLG